jgi:HD-GYP domain-containing protein (c-di-GMP phosphodiesterase class II)
MDSRARIRLLVTAVAISALAVGWSAWETHEPFPGLWALSVFVLASFLVEFTSTPVNLGVAGSTSFVIHIAGGLLFGSFWGGLIASLSTLLSQINTRSPAIKVVFNTAQRGLCVAVGVLLYQAIGGQVVPQYLLPGGHLSDPGAQRDLAFFFVFAFSYFAINAVLISGAVATSTGRSFREVWDLNARGVFGYDMAASTLGIALAFIYTASERALGFGALGFIAVLAPMLVIRHVYGLYRRLQTSGRELLDLMVKAIEARDPYTSGHSVRVATLSKAIAYELNLSPELVEEIYTAAVLHDVGKIHEEFAPLLRKESKLTPEETALLQTHAVKSADLVGIISNFRGRVQDTVRSHHERWDGGGYPDGLAQDQIPLGSRIIMISDTADAMMTDRPYRKRLPLEAVVAELQRHRGTQFDPMLVDMVVNSVTIRRTMADIEPLSRGNIPEVPEGGSHRIGTRLAQVAGRGRHAWPRVRSF